MRKRIRLQAGPLARFRYAATSTASKVLALLGVLAAAGILIWGAIPNIPYVYHAAATFVDHHGSIIRDDISIAKEITAAPETAALLSYRYEGRVFLTQTRECVGSIKDMAPSQRRDFDAAALQFENSLNAFIPDESEIRADFDKAKDSWAAVKRVIDRNGGPASEACAVV